MSELGALPVGAHLIWRAPYASESAVAEVAELIEGGYRLRSEEGVSFAVSRDRLEMLHAIDPDRCRVVLGEAPLPEAPPPERFTLARREQLRLLRSFDPAACLFEYSAWEPATESSHLVISRFSPAEWYGLIGTRREHRSRRRAASGLSVAVPYVVAYQSLMMAFVESWFGISDNGMILLGVAGWDVGEED